MHVVLRRRHDTAGKLKEGAGRLAFNSVDNIRKAVRNLWVQQKAHGLIPEDALDPSQRNDQVKQIMRTVRERKHKENRANYAERAVITARDPKRI